MTRWLILCALADAILGAILLPLAIVAVVMWMSRQDR